MMMSQFILSTIDEQTFLFMSVGERKHAEVKFLGHNCTYGQI